MKKGSFLLLLLLAGCTPVESPTISTTVIPVTSTALGTSPTLSPTPLPPTPTIILIPIATVAEEVRSNLALDDRCPHFCWLEINPGVTTVEEARALLKASSQVDQTTISETATEILVDWDGLPVSITIENSLVKEIIFGVQDLVLRMFHFSAFLGEPDEISIRVLHTYHCDEVVYDLYYSSRKAAVTVFYASPGGPNLYDSVSGMTLNTEFDLSDRQPWLGYGHIQEYLPEKKLPSNPCQSLPTPTP